MDTTPLSPNSARIHSQILNAFSPKALEMITASVREGQSSRDVGGASSSSAIAGGAETHNQSPNPATSSHYQAAPQAALDSGQQTPQTRYSHAPIPQPTKSSLQPSGQQTPQSGPTRSSSRKTRTQTAAQSGSQQQQQSSSQSTSQRYAPYPKRSGAPPAAPPPAAPPAFPAPAVPVPTQALHTTYGSRLRTGATLLMQPIHVAPPQAPAIAANVHAAESRAKRRAAVNYAELDSFSEDDDEEPDEGDDNASEYAGEGPRGGPVYVTGASHGASSRATKGRVVESKNELERSYLGEPPPARHVVKRHVGKYHTDYISQDAINKAAEYRECLIPIRVEFDTDTHRVRDCFLWNIHERHITPEAFATQFLTDIEVPQSFADQVAAMIRGQVEEFEAVALFGEGEADIAEPEEEQADTRVFLNLDVQLSTYHIIDTLEYSISPSSYPYTLSPTALSRTLTHDLSLPPSSAPLIAHALTEELFRRKKDAIEAGVLGGPMGTAILSRAKPKEGVGIWREVGLAGWMGGGAPHLEVLSGEERERREGERERAIRRLRRDTARQQQVSVRRRR